MGKRAFSNKVSISHTYGKAAPVNIASSGEHVEGLPHNELSARSLTHMQMSDVMNQM